MDGLTSRKAAGSNGTPVQAEARRSSESAPRTVEVGETAHDGVLSPRAAGESSGSPKQTQMGKKSKKHDGLRFSRGSVASGHEHSEATSTQAHTHNSGETHVVRLFGDMKLKKGVAQLDEIEYSVTDYYHASGLCQMFARSEVFGNCTLGLICVNAVYLGVEQDNNVEGNFLYRHPIFYWSDQFFCAFFFLEWFCRFGAFKHKRDCFKDTWFKFDTFLVILMVGETWIMPVSGLDVSSGGGMFAMLRLLRLARMTRLLRSVPELWTLLKGMKAATRAVTATLALLIVMIYVFAIVFHILLKKRAKHSEAIDESWGTLPRCMWILLMTGTFMDNITGVLSDLSAEGPLLVGIFLAFVLLSSLTVMNMLIGVLCEVVSAVAVAEQENKAILELNASLLSALKAIDRDGNGEITAEEISCVVTTSVTDPGSLEVLEVVCSPSPLVDSPPPEQGQSPPAGAQSQKQPSRGSRGVLEDIGIDVNFFLDYAEMVFETESSLPLEECLELALLWQKDNTCSVETIVRLNQYIRWYLTKRLNVLGDAVQECTEQEDRLERRVGELEENQVRMYGHLSRIGEQMARLRTVCKTAELDVPVSLAAVEHFDTSVEDSPASINGRHRPLSNGAQQTPCHSRGSLPAGKLVL